MYLPEQTSLLMNIFIIIVLIMAIIIGYSKGFISQVLNLLGVFVAAFVAWMLYVPLGKMFKLIPKSLVPFQDTILKDFFYEKMNTFFWFIILFVATIIIIKILTPILEFISKTPVINTLNRIFGALFSVVSLWITTMMLILCLSMPIFLNGRDIINNSWLRHFETGTSKVITIIGENFDQLQAVQKLAVLPKQATIEDLEFAKQWLENNGLNLDQIRIFIEELGK